MNNFVIKHANKSAIEYLFLLFYLLNIVMGYFWPILEKTLSSNTVFAFYVLLLIFEGLFLNLNYYRIFSYKLKNNRLTQDHYVFFKFYKKRKNLHVSKLSDLIDYTFSIYKADKEVSFEVLNDFVIINEKRLTMRIKDQPFITGFAFTSFGIGLLVNYLML